MCPEWQLLPPSPSAHSLPLSPPNPTLSPAVNLGAFNAQNFSNHRPFSLSLCASHDKYRTLLPFPNELRHTCAPPNHAWDHTVFKGQGWVATGEWENKWSYSIWIRKKGNTGRQKKSAHYFLHCSLWKSLPEQPPPSSLPLLSSSALLRTLSHPWVWPTPLPIDRSVVSTRLHPHPHPLVTHTWRRAGDCLLRILAPSWGLGATPWDFPVSWRQLQVSVTHFVYKSGIQQQVEVTALTIK